jgi:hypothetical protein
VTEEPEQQPTGERESPRDDEVAGALLRGSSQALTAPQRVIPPVVKFEPRLAELEPALTELEPARAELEPARAELDPEPAPEPATDAGPSDDPAGSAAVREVVQIVEVEARRQLTILREHAREPSPLPSTGAPIDELVWGFAQPLLGVRLLLRHGDLFVRGLVPACVFVLVCAFLVERGHGFWALVVAYYGVLVGAASFSPILFCRNYAKLAAESRRHLDLPRHAPYLRSYRQAIAEAVAQAIVLGVGVAPWLALIGGLPLFGGIWAAVLGWVWVLHWIVVEALDSARTLPPGESPETLEQRYARLDPPWYSGARLAGLRDPLPTLLLPLRLWGSLLAWLGRRWRGEVALIEVRPFLAAGFGLGASLLLLVPVLNLLLRPALVIAGSHVLGRLEPELQLPDPDPDPESELEPEPVTALALAPDPGAQA